MKSAVHVTKRAFIYIQSMPNDVIIWKLVIIVRTIKIKIDM